MSLFSGEYPEQAALSRVAEAMWQDIDLLALPTTPTIYRIAEMRGAPIALNSNLGLYTNFVNLLDLCGLAVPAAMRADGVPSGITLLAPAGNDAMLASVGWMALNVVLRDRLRSLLVCRGSILTRRPVRAQDAALLWR